MWEKNREHGANTQQVLDLESIDVGVMRWLVVVEHEVDHVGRGADEQKFECGEIERFGESPEKV